MPQQLNFDRNFLYFYLVWIYKTCRNLPNPDVTTDDHPEGVPTIPVVYNQGGTRSAKTWEIIAFIYTFCDHNRNSRHKVGVYRDTMVNCRDITLTDFVDCFEYIGLEPDVDYDIVRSPRPIITIGKCTIEFMGIPELGKEGGKMSICYINELIENNNQQVVKNLFQRTTHICIGDWNPSVTEHWCLSEKAFNLHRTNTTYLDNVFLQDSLKSKYESWCPWDFSDSHVETYGQIEVNGKLEGGFKRRVWHKPECPEGEIWTTAHRKPNKYNIENGTADRVQWLVYGEGIPCAREGSIYEVDQWINEFPNEDYEDLNYGLDFGYSNDPSSLVKVGRRSRELTIKYEFNAPTKDPFVLWECIRPILQEEEDRRRIEHGWKKKDDGTWKQGHKYPEILIVCDSKDTSEGYHFVNDLNLLAHGEGKGWYFFKCKKPKITVRIGIMNRFRLRVVRDKTAEFEFNNYVWKIIDGRSVNIPVDKNNHGLDAAGYKVFTFDRFAVE